MEHSRWYKQGCNTWQRVDSLPQLDSHQSPGHGVQIAVCRFSDVSGAAGATPCVSALNGWGASFNGLLLGAPPGVCVYCAAPIAFGMYKCGARAELAIAAMISSPVFNVIVLSMLLSLFAWPLVLIKLALTLIVIFVFVPLLVRLFSEETWSNNLGSASPVNTVTAASAGRVCLPMISLDSHRGTLHWIAKSPLNNARYLLIRVVPIMLIAGLLGSLVVTLTPCDLLPNVVAASAWWKIILTVLLLSVFGLLLPVPIAFEVLICATLLNAGMPIKCVAVYARRY